MAGPMYYSYDGARVSSESALGKELAKFEQPNYRPSEHPYPRMLYRAQHRKDGRRSVGEILDSVCGGHDGAAAQFTSRCQMTVGDEGERQKYYESGWRDTQAEALEYLEAQDNAKSNITAERHASDVRMGDLAQREAAAADHKTLKHLPEIPRTPVQRRTKVEVAPEA